jgi:hypothetical protein
MDAVTDATRTFNTPLEAGLRALFVLAAAGKKAYDSQKLVYFDYILVHSGDLDGPPSLHPQAPSQKGELLVRRNLLQDGLALMRSRDLVERKFQATGIVWAATDAGAHLARQFDSEYAVGLRDRAGWVIESFGPKSYPALADLLGARIGDWHDEVIVEHLPGSMEGDRG